MNLVENRYPIAPIVQKGELPDLFAWPDGRRVHGRADWLARAADWRDQVVEILYGGLPPAPAGVRFETLDHATLWDWPEAPRFWSYRIHCEGGARPFSFTAQLLFPDSGRPVPVILNGDGCWWNLTTTIAKEILAAGCAIIQFNRTELAEDLGYDGDHDKKGRRGGLYDVFPGQAFGALSAWAWGYHRCVDLLQSLPFIDGTRIAATGHSRGGKTTLLAAATDPRITLINDNASGTAGSALFRYVGHGGETLQMARIFPSWFGPAIQEYVGREETLPFASIWGFCERPSPGCPLPLSGQHVFALLAANQTAARGCPSGPAAVHHSRCGRSATSPVAHGIRGILSSCQSARDPGNAHQASCRQPIPG
jgi:hypothetical protein